MPSQDELYNALRNAHAAGDTEAARKIAAYIQSSTASPAPVVPSRAPTPADIPRDAGNDYRSAAEPNVKKNEEGLVNKFIGNVVEPVLTVGTGMVGSVIGSLAGAGSAVTSGKFGTQEGIREGEKTVKKVAEALTYQPRTDSGKENVKALGKLMQDSGVAGLPIGPEFNAMARLASPSAGQAARGVAAAGDVASAAGGKVLDAGARAIASQINPETLALAEKAKKFGIEVRPDMLFESNLARIVGETLEIVPLTGAKGDGRQTAFNRAIIKQIGGDRLAKRLTPDVFDKAMRRSGEKIGEISEKTPVKFDGELAEGLQAIMDTASKRETADVAKVVAGYIDEISSKSIDGVIDGTYFRKITSELGSQTRRTQNGDLKHALSEIQDAMHDGLTRSIADPADLAALIEARTQYRIGKIIQPLVAKTPDGDISAPRLMSAVTANGSGKEAMARGRGGEIGELAQIGQQFMKDPPNSNTPARFGVYGAMGSGAGVSAVLEPNALVGTLAAANAYNRLGPKAVSKLLERMQRGRAEKAGRGPGTVDVSSGIPSALDEIGSAESVDAAIRAASRTD